MPTAPCVDVRRGEVIAFDRQHWLVLDTGLGPRPHGFYPPIEFVLQPLPSGSIRVIQLLGGRDQLEVVPTEARSFYFVCNQHGEMLFRDPTTDEILTLPGDWTDLPVLALESGAEVTVRYFHQQPVWMARLNEVT